MAKKATRRTPTKACPKCGAGNHARRKLCTKCGDEMRPSSHATVTKLDGGMVIDWPGTEAKEPQPTNGHMRASIDHIKSAAELLRLCDNDLDIAGMALQDAHDILKTWTE